VQLFARGPKGTIPMLRHSFGPYVRGEVSVPSIEEYERRSHVPSMAPRIDRP
jgi:hypothetical protein